MSTFLTLWSIIVLISVIWVIYDALLKNDSLSKTATFLWIVIALIFGIIGVIAYYFLGREEIDYTIKKRRR